MKYSFRNDYNTIGCKEVLECLINNSSKQYVGYGFDEETKKLEQRFKDLTNENIDLYLLTGGTQVNLVTISKALLDYEAVISVNTGHINVHETGAVEATGHKIITTPGVNGKITVDEIKHIVSIHTDCHMVKPKLVYISNTTEVGTYYTLEELKNIYNTCQDLGLFLFLDGARLSVALVASGLTLSDIAKYTDVFYFGGTKNGLPYGEALIIKNDLLKKDFSYHLKNKGAMLAKTYVVALMFNELLTNDLYLVLAKHANSCARLIEKELKKIEEITLDNVESNQIFITLDNNIASKLNELYDFEIWEKNTKTKIRLVTSYNTNITMCYMLINDLKNLIK